MNDSAAPAMIKHRHGGWHEHNLTDLGDATEPHVHGCGTWLMSFAELRAAIGETDSSEGLPHWHTVSDTPDGQPRHGVYVERSAVLKLVALAETAFAPTLTTAEAVNARLGGK